MRHVPYRTLVLLPAAALLAACASSSGARQPAAGPACEVGTPVLVIRNDSGRDVEIVEQRAGRGAGSVIGILPGGRHEILLRNLRGYSYYARSAGGGALLASAHRSRAGSTVTLERICRTA